MTNLTVRDAEGKSWALMRQVITSAELLGGIMQLVYGNADKIAK